MPYTSLLILAGQGFRGPDVSTHGQRRGELGEALARRHLISLGYRIIEANFRTRNGELDLIAEKDGELVFIEVRARGPSPLVTPEESVNQAKRDRLLTTAQEYLQARGAEERDWRIELVAVGYGRDGSVTRIEVIENAVEG